VEPPSSGLTTCRRVIGAGCIANRAVGKEEAGNGAGGEAVPTRYEEFGSKMLKSTVINLRKMVFFFA